MRTSEIPKAIRILKQEYRRFKTPYVTEVAAGKGKDPFKVLISCILSLRTKDDVTREASTRLFRLADAPAGISRLTAKEIERAIYPAGFYRVKSRVILDISREIERDHGGRVPDTIEGLLELKGVGRKTANLVVTMGYGKPGICVDTHVHRIVNRWGFVDTKTPDQTESALREKLPKRYWIMFNMHSERRARGLLRGQASESDIDTSLHVEDSPRLAAVSFNDLLVAFGQNVCKPVSPLCGGCRLNALCRRRGVLKSR